MTAVRVLVVDDQPSFRQVMADLVDATAGLHHVADAADQAGALAAVQRHHPDIALIDINLGEDSGIELARHLAETAPAVRVILMSTYPADDLPSTATTCGAQAYVHKASLTPATLAALAAPSAPGSVA